MGAARFWIVAVIASRAFGCATASDTPVSGKAAPRLWEDVPARWYGTHILVEVGINGAPQRLVLDTGADATVLAPDLVSQLGVSTFKRELAWETQRGRAASRQFTCARVNVRLGALSQEADVLVDSLDGFSRAFGEPVDGTLGLHMWAGPTSEGQARMRVDLPGGPRSPRGQPAEPVWPSCS